MKTILVTGANGFIGSHVLTYLSNQPNEKIRLIAACRNRHKLPAGYSGEVREGDLRDNQYLSMLLNDVDIIVNGMAWSSLWGNIKYSRELFYEPNIKLIDQYLMSNASQFVNISTTAAAAPDHSFDPMSEGIPRAFWPHLVNVIHIENYLKRCATDNKKVVNMRLGIFAGERYALGVLPILIPRLKTHLVPWVKGGKTHLAITDGRDLGMGVGLAALKNSTTAYNAYNIVGKEIPTVREVILFLHDEYGYPKPHFSVPFAIAYPFAWMMEKLDVIVPWEPLIVRSIVHLLEDTHVNNDKAIEELGYKPQYDWRETIRLQLAEMSAKQDKPMSMAKPV